MMFIPRLKKPESGNKYYNTPAKGGYAVGAILGKPTDSGCNVLANCVGYAAGRFNEIIGQNCFVYFQYAPNPKDWIATAKTHGLQTGADTITATTLPSELRPTSTFYATLIARDVGGWALANLAPASFSIDTNGAVMLRTGAAHSSAEYVIGYISWLAAK